MEEITFVVERQYAYIVTNRAESVTVEQVQEAMEAENFEDQALARFTVFSEDGHTIASGDVEYEWTEIRREDA